MKIDNIVQADAVQRWIERVNKHILELHKLSKISSLSTADSVTVSTRLKESLEASLITYTEDKNYGNAPQESNEETERRVCDSGEVVTVTISEGTDPASQGTEHEAEKAEVDHDLSSKSFESQR